MAPDLEELERIWQLRKAGAITEAEFLRLKSGVLEATDESVAAHKTSQDAQVTSDGSAPPETRRKSPIAIFAVASLVALMLIIGAVAASGNGGTDTNGRNAEGKLIAADMNAVDMNALDMNATDINATVADLTSKPAPRSGTAGSSETAAMTEEENEPTNFSSSESNAMRSAEQYLRMSGFSRDGLIEQLSSSAGDGYSVADATAAVDSLNVNWNENAARSARQYLNMSAFSCDGLIEQLSSSAGDKYTVDQATYGAHQAGVC